MTDTIEVGGNSYRIGRLDARKQFHVARRLAPILPALGGMKTGKDMMMSIAPVAEALSKMSEEDTDYVLDTCLAVCQRIQGNGQGAPLMARGGGLMFQDIDMPQMIQLTIQVLRENLAGFFPAAAAEPQQIG